MRVLNEKIDLNAFQNSLERSQEPLLILDYDGTLAPFKINPAEAVPYPGMIEILNNLISTTRSRIIIVSGRAIKDLLPLLKLDILPEIWGSHGGERFDAESGYTCYEILPQQEKGLESGWSLLNQILPEERCERKTLSIAGHWRGFDEETVKKFVSKIEPGWANLAKEYGLEVHRFNAGMELRPKGINKGYVIRQLLSSTPAINVKAYLGDDATDEQAFEALGEQGLKVLVNCEEKPTHADIQLTPPDELLTFLSRWQETTKRKK